MSLHRKSRLQAFRYATRGIVRMLQSEFNARVHAVATIVVIAVGLTLDIGRGEWLALVLAISAVWCAEGFNTAFEAICDVASPEYHPEVERAKDVSAGAVLVTAIAAVVVGLLIFGPHLLVLVRD